MYTLVEFPYKLSCVVGIATQFKTKHERISLLWILFWYYCTHLYCEVKLHFFINCVLFFVRQCLWLSVFVRATSPVLYDRIKSVGAVTPEAKWAPKDGRSRVNPLPVQDGGTFRSEPPAFRHGACRHVSKPCHFGGKNSYFNLMNNETEFFVFCKYIIYKHYFKIYLRCLWYHMWRGPELWNLTRLHRLSTKYINKCFIICLLHINYKL